MNWIILLEQVEYNCRCFPCHVSKSYCSHIKCSYVVTFNILIGTFTENGSAILIAASVGGATLFCLIFIFCAAIMCIRQHQKKRSCESSRKVTGLSSEVNISTSSSYNITTLSKQDRMSYEDQYNYIMLEKHLFPSNTQNRAVNPSCKRTQENTVAYDTTIVHLNSFHSSNFKQGTKVSENEYLHIYTENSQCCPHVTEGMGYTTMTRSTTDAATSNVKIHTNPSYDAAPGGVKLNENPSYKQSTPNFKTNSNPSC